MVHRGDTALDIIEGNHFDAIVLDIMLPGRDGLSILRSLRTRSNALPVILLTARGQIAEKVEGLDLGADSSLARLAGYGSNINAAPAISVGTRAPRKRYSGEIPASPNREARID